MRVLDVFKQSYYYINTPLFYFNFTSSCPSLYLLTYPHLQLDDGIQFLQFHEASLNNEKRTSQIPTATFAQLACMSPCSLLSVHLVARAELFLLLTKAIPHAFCIPAAPVYPKCFPSNSPFSPPFFFPSLHMSTFSVSSAYKQASDLFFFFSSSIFTLLSGLYNLLPGLLQWLPNGFSYIYLLLVPHTVCSHHSSQKELFKTCQVVMNAPSSKILTESPCHSE